MKHNIDFITDAILIWYLTCKRENKVNEYGYLKNVIKKSREVKDGIAID